MKSNQSTSRTHSPKLSSSLPWPAQLSSFPSSPGVYWFTGKNDDVLYVGKAKNLRSRVGSYARLNKNDHPKTVKLVKLSQKINFKTLASDIIALLTEAELIKTYQPPYNILLKDDKTPLYLSLTKEKFPRLLPVRKKTLTTTPGLKRSNIFGPFPSGYSAKIIIKAARKVFKFCSSSPAQKKAGKPCFYTHLDLCSGACTGSVSPKAYAQMIKHLKLFLRGKRKTLTTQLKKSMDDYSKKHQYENASTIRDQIISIDNLYSLQSTTPDKNLPILQQDESAGKLKHLNFLLSSAGLTPASYPLDRIEAYDVSNISGTHPTASMVVFVSGRPSTSEYRHFKIRSIKGPNDPAMLSEALTRRLNHPEWPYPNLFVIDGGKSQLSSATKIIGNTRPTISIVKNPDRVLILKPSSKSKGPKNTYLEIKLKTGEPAANLLQHIRDESHRFAKNYHSYLRRKNLTASQS